MPATGVVVRGNEARNNGGYGIRVRDAADTVVESNTLSGNVEGDLRRD